MARSRRGRDARSRAEPPDEPSGSAGLREQTRALAPPRDPTSDECKKLLDALRERCPGLLPADRLKPGQTGPEIPLEAKAADQLVRAASRAVAGGGTVLWDDGASQLLVHAAEVRTVLDDGLVLVRVPVECDQTKRALVQVAFAVGDAKRPAGLLATTETRPRGPAEVIDVWGDALIAFAWHAVLRMATVLSAETGTDLDGVGLVPLAIAATGEGLRVQTLARHSFDRQPR